MLALSIPFGVCGAENVYTLYRNGVSNPQLGIDLAKLRAHVATFDAAQEEGYNRENCETSRRLFQSQAKLTVRYWCEKGRFKE